MQSWLRTSTWAGVSDVTELPEMLVERMRHYFLTYKLVPGETSTVTIDRVYGRDHAQKVIMAAVEDYRPSFGAAATSE